MWRVIQSQVVYHDGSATDTIIEVNLKHPGKQNRNITRNHRWAVYVNPVGQDAAVAPFNARCMAAGFMWNPGFVQLTDPRNVNFSKLVEKNGTVAIQLTYQFNFIGRCV